MITRVEEWAARAIAKRSPPIWVSSSAARYSQATRNGPIRRGGGRSRASCAVSATDRARLSSRSRRSRTWQTKTTSAESTDRAMICAMWLAVASPPWNIAMNTWAATATTPTRAVSRGPAMEAVSAGAMTSNGPRWMVEGEWMSTTVITTISASGIATSPWPDDRSTRRSTDTRRASIYPILRLMLGRSLADVARVREA